MRAYIYANDANGLITCVKIDAHRNVRRPDALASTALTARSFRRGSVYSSESCRWVLQVVPRGNPIRLEKLVSARRVAGSAQNKLITRTS